MRRVKGLLRRAGLTEQIATLMALLATESPREEVETHGKKHFVATGPRSLPQGAPTSPSITNALCMRLDCRLSGLARKLGCRYTRYADDLTFSWHGPKRGGALPASPVGGAAAPGNARSDIGGLLRATRMIVRAEGFEIHTKKTRVMRHGSRQKVTGLVVNAAPGRPPARVPRETVRRLRAAIKNRELGRPGKGESLEQLKGMAAFIMMTDRERGHAFMDRIDRLLAARGETEVKR
jgi:RNA-directed DNA polymerase